MTESKCAGAYYAADVLDFIATPSELVLGSLSSASTFDINATQRDAWEVEIEVLKRELAGVPGTLFLEFDVPRVGSRIDAVLVSGPAVFVIEFKVGESRHSHEHLNQVWDYALDLKNFHQASHAAPILPLLVATESVDCDAAFQPPSADAVFPPARCGRDGLRRLVEAGLRAVAGDVLDALRWGQAPYLPTPTIIEAARALYAHHSVEAIARHDAGARNLALTSQRLEQIIETARRDRRKVIAFVTGVPGSGKTLVGLNVATRKRDAGAEHAVFLSGNAPLVAVLREALVRDDLRRRRRAGEGVRKGEVAQQVKAFIQNVHHFRDAGLRDDGPPAEHVTIFDEAQRAWNLRKTANFMLRRKKRAGFAQSEPEFLMSYLDRHKDWAVVICLVGGGQEINDGEMGIAGWLDAIDTSFRHWTAWASPTLSDNEYDAGRAIERLRRRGNVQEDRDLHLSVSMRSFRAEHVSAFVKALLDCDVGMARTALGQVSRYPVVLTRDLGRARQWLRDHSRGTEQVGLLASSGAQRLKPHAIDVRVSVNPVHWFLNRSSDPRASGFLEDAATEFQVQGLEVDWSCVTWDADFRFVNGQWSHHAFVGGRWHVVRNPDRQRYLKNAYRVLLTRARQGMVIFVPPGDSRDPTRPPEYYERTFQYLKDLGVEEI